VALRKYFPDLSKGCACYAKHKVSYLCRKEMMAKIAFIKLRVLGGRGKNDPNNVCTCE
jgi:hypothetical protein